MVTISCICPFCLNEGSNFLSTIGYCTDWESDKTPKLVKTFGTVSCCKCKKVFLIHFQITQSQYNEAKQSIESLDKAYFISAPTILEVLPPPKEPYSHPAFPGKIKQFFKEIEKIESPSFKAGLARSILEFSLKNLNIGTEEDSLYDRIQQAYKQGLITKPLAEWAHIVRRLGNKAIHEIEATEAEAEEIISFLKLFFDLTYKVPHEISKYFTR
jgi:hypothetical protein